MQKQASRATSALEQVLIESIDLAQDLFRHHGSLARCEADLELAEVESDPCYPQPLLAT